MDVWMNFKKDVPAFWNGDVPWISVNLMSKDFISESHRVLRRLHTMGIMSSCQCADGGSVSFQHVGNLDWLLKKAWMLS